MVRLDYIFLRQAVPFVDNPLRKEVQSCVAATVAFQQFPSMTLVPVSPAVWKKSDHGTAENPFTILNTSRRSAWFLSSRDHKPNLMTHGCYK